MLWYSTYQVTFAATYTLSNPTDQSLTLYFDLELPANRAVYDDFTLSVDSRRISDVPILAGHLVQPVDLAPGQRLPVHVSYRSQGLDQWRYSFGRDVSQVSDFELVMRTDFAAIDFSRGQRIPRLQDPRRRRLDPEVAFTIISSPASIWG